jgi:hypothetical protein
MVRVNWLRQMLKDGSDSSISSGESTDYAAFVEKQQSASSVTANERSDGEEGCSDANERSGREGSSDDDDDERGGGGGSSSGGGSRSSSPRSQVEGEYRLDGAPYGLLAWHDAAAGVAIPLASQIAGGLSYLHGCDVLHRDLKPNNVLVTADWTQAKITDFGLSKMIDPAGECIVI